MKMAEQKQPIPGQKVGEPTLEELKANELKMVQEKKRIIDDLNKIAYPLSVTVFSHQQTWTIRNIAFWKAMQKRDTDITEFMEQYLQEKR